MSSTMFLYTPTSFAYMFVPTAKPRLPSLSVGIFITQLTRPFPSTWTFAILVRDNTPPTKSLCYFSSAAAPKTFDRNSFEQAASMVFGPVYATSGEVSAIFGRRGELGG